MPLAIQLSPHDEQTDFNLTCWDRILADPDLASLNQRLETDRHGNIVMSPPPPEIHTALNNPRSTIISDSSDSSFRRP